MGNKESKLNEDDRPKQINIIKSNLLLFKRCIFLTQKEYNDRVFKPNLCYYKQVYIESNNELEIDNEVKRTIIHLSKNTGNNKVPVPIYVMYAKKLVPTGSYFDETCIYEYKTYQRLLNEANIKIQVERDKHNKIIEDINNNNKTASDKDLEIKSENIRYENEIKKINLEPSNYYNNTSCIKNNKDKELIAKQIFNNEEAYSKSLFRKFNFNGYDVHIFIPNLNSDGQYISNLNDYSLTNDWIKTMSTEDYYYTIISLIKTDYKKIYSKYTNDENLLNAIQRILTSKEHKRLHFIRESNNTCFYQGCVSDYGEDLSILPNGSSSDGDLSKAAKAMSPWYPTKCLKRLNYPLQMFKDDKEKIDSKINEAVDINGECFKTFKDNIAKIAEENIDDLEDTEDDLLSHLKNCAYEKIHEDIGKDKSKYSQRYNKDIIKELAKRNSGQPGVQENSFPLFRLNENENSIKNYLIQMPWGNKLIGNDYVLNLNTPLLEGNYISSFNNNYKLMLFTNGVIGVINNSKVVKYLLNDIYFKQTNKELVFEDGGYLTLYGDDINNKKIQLWSLYISKVDDAIIPYSLILDDNGYIKIYDNGFNIRNSNALDNIINNNGKIGYPSLSKFNYDEYMKYLPSNIIKNINMNINTNNDPYYDNNNNNNYLKAEQQLRLLSEYYNDGNELTDSQIKAITDNPELRDSLINMNNNRNINNNVNINNINYRNIDDKLAYEFEKDIFIRLQLNKLATPEDNKIFESLKPPKQKIKEFIEQNY
jgi:hypothetical protein